MTEGAGKLRRADEQQIRGMIAALRHGGRFVIVVVEEATWPEVKKALASSLSPPTLHEVRLVTGEDVIRLFSSPVVESDGTVILRIGADAAGAVEALNLHRDKLRQKRCRFVLWLEGAAVHERFVREAPDCYSFRDAVAVVEGRPAVAPIQHDSELLELLQRQVAEAEEPGQLLELGRELFDLDRLDEAHRALERGIGILGARKELSPEERSTLAYLHYIRTFDAAPEVDRDHSLAALRILEPVREQFESQYANVLGGLCDGYGIDVYAAREALAIARRSGALDPSYVARQLGRLAQALCEREDVKGAREALRQVPFPWWGSRHNERIAERLEADILIQEGRWEEAEQRLRTSLTESAQGQFANWFSTFAVRLAQLLVSRGELEAALDALAPVASEGAESLWMYIRCLRGEREAMTRLAGPLVDPLPRAEHLTDALYGARGTANLVRRAVGAGLLNLERCERLDAEIEALAAHIASVAPADPPWSRIRAELLVADNLLARSGAEELARAAAQRALVLARAGAPELIPQCVRRIGVAALRADIMDGLAELLDEAFSAAEAHWLPGEAARLAGLRLWHVTRLGRDVEEAERALDAAIERTGSVLLEAEVLARVGRGADRRDLLERSRRIYRALPWPEREGECLEALGMKAAARARYEAFGLRLEALALERRTAPIPISA